MPPSTRKPPAVEIVGRRRPATSKSTLRRAARLVLEGAAPAASGSVTIVLTGDAQIRELNRRFRGKDAATDVLSFRLGDGANANEPFGDIVISLDAAARQAHAYRANLEAEVLRLLVHGTLHLCGYDHREPREAARMHALTQRFVQQALGRPPENRRPSKDDRYRKRRRG